MFLKGKANDGEKLQSEVEPNSTDEGSEQRVAGKLVETEIIGDALEDGHSDESRSNSINHSDDGNGGKLPIDDDLASIEDAELDHDADWEQRHHAAPESGTWQRLLNALISFKVALLPSIYCYIYHEKYTKNYATRNLGLTTWAFWRLQD